MLSASSWPVSSCLVVLLSACWGACRRMGRDGGPKQRNWPEHGIPIPGLLPNRAAGGTSPGQHQPSPVTERVRECRRLAMLPMLPMSPMLPSPGPFSMQGFLGVAPEYILGCWVGAGDWDVRSIHPLAFWNLRLQLPAQTLSVSPTQASLRQLAGRYIQTQWQIKLLRTAAASGLSNPGNCKIFARPAMQMCVIRGRQCKAWAGRKGLSGAGDGNSRPRARLPS